ncbi:hypothetical protein GCM10009760_06670 [Kitasatospora kazusensis]|uniref:SPOR domain-containing protein n=1 Tax=Kitasatospora kazusensis TaxID=407974 RepID=A0ABP5KK46_9ACTN
MRALVLLLAPFAVVGLLILLLRWTYGTGKSLIAREPRPGEPDEYGLLVPVASPTDRAEAERLAGLLAAAGLRYTLAPTNEGLRLMVWPEDEQTAKDALRR